MQPTRDLPMPLRLSVAGLGIVFISLSVIAAVTLRDTGWRWGHATFALICAVEGIDFVVAASRHRGAWPIAPFFVLDLLSFWT